MLILNSVSTALEIWNSVPAYLCSGTSVYKEERQGWEGHLFYFLSEEQFSFFIKSCTGWEAFRQKVNLRLVYRMTVVIIVKA